MKFFLKTFGCQSNNFDSKKIDIILNTKFFKTRFNNFDILIFNTCSIREYSQKKVFHFLKKNKKINFLSIFTGCVSDIFFYTILKKKYINLILNYKSLFCLKFLIFFSYFYYCKQISFDFFKINNKHIFKNNLNIIITYGCNKYCSYCIVPYTKGKEIHINFFLILKDIFYILFKFNEVILLGQNVNSYKYFFLKKCISFYVLLSFIYEFSNNFIINYLSLNFMNFSFSLYFYKNMTFLHIPLQSASNKILIYMKRNYLFNSYKNFIYYLKLKFNYFLITTDIILCFPNEYNNYFNKTLISIEKILFDKSYIFIYNVRSYTSSFLLFNNINIILKKKRFLILNYKIRNNIFYINKSLFYKNYNFFLKNLFLLCNNIFYFYINNRIFLLFFLNINSFFFLKIKLVLKVVNFFLSFFFI